MAMDIFSPNFSLILQQSQFILIHTDISLYSVPIFFNHTIFLIYREKYFFLLKYNSFLPNYHQAMNNLTYS